MPNRWLVKTEPSAYAFDDLEAERRTVWDGVTNALALQHIRKMKKGDDVLVYHSGKDKAIVGTATVARGSYPDPRRDDERIVVVDLEVGRRLARPLPLKEVKAQARFADWELVRVPRLSVMPVPANVWRWALKKRR
jgi:predicted RNA-binding protein with PUA-like domain